MEDISTLTCSRIHHKEAGFSRGDKPRSNHIYFYSVYYPCLIAVMDEVRHYMDGESVREGIIADPYIIDKCQPKDFVKDS